MDEANIGKARWARRRAADLLQQAQALEQDRTGDWRSWRRRGEVASGLRREAARFDRMAAGWRDPKLTPASW